MLQLLDSTSGPDATLSAGRTEELAEKPGLPATSSILGFDRTANQCLNQASKHYALHPTSKTASFVGTKLGAAKLYVEQFSQEDREGFNEPIGRKTALGL